MWEDTSRKSSAEIRSLFEWGRDAADNPLGRMVKTPKNSKDHQSDWMGGGDEIAVGSIGTRTSLHDSKQKYARGRQHNEEEKYGKNTFKLINCMNSWRVDTNCQKPISNHQLSPVRGIDAKKPELFYYGALSVSSLSSNSRGLDCSWWLRMLLLFLCA